jgi:hypothetical protein
MAVPARLSPRLLAVALLATLFPVSAALAGPNSDEPAPKGDATPAGPKPLEVRFTDNSVLKLVLKEETVEVRTPYGNLRVPVADIEKVEFGLRVPEEAKKKIESAIAGLGDPQFRNRETASAVLLALREKAYPALVEAAKSSDSETANRAEELLKKIRETVPEEFLSRPNYDVVHTATSKIAGRIDAATLKAESTQFGVVNVRLADVFAMGTKLTAPAVDSADVAIGPPSMTQHHNDIGKTLKFRVTGNAAAGSVWGTDVYTTDSALAAVVVHAGVLKQGETGVVKVTMLPSPPAFVGSARNGVTSAPYQQYPAAYKVAK